ncbi:uncharacterized protein LOC105733627 [Aotus nancymaae]|uniref:uncharacterized protein LOC105733627 n=1 Tax=Aotus nancymaae TaxID=37293 RepID=UPI0030FE85F0
MGNHESHLDPKLPLGCLVQNLHKLGLSIKKKRLVFLSTVAWPQYSLDNQSKWPPEGTLNFNVLTALDNFCQRNGKWSEVPYVQAFWYLRSRPALCSSSSAQVLPAKAPPLPSAPPGSALSENPGDLSCPARFTNPPPHVGPQLPLPSSPSPPQSPNMTSPVSACTCSHDPPICYPLREVAGAEGVVQVHVPFSLSDLSAIEKRLGSFSTNPTAYTKEFCYLTQAYDLTWHDTYIILSSTLTLDERDRILRAARAYADQVHLTNNQMPVGAVAVPEADPDWNYQTGQDGRQRRDQMLQCLLAGMQSTAQKVVNYDKLREITQGPTENPAAFLNRLTNAMILHTRLDPASLAGATVLATHFIYQSAADIRKKLKKAEEGPQTPIRDLVNMAFKVFNGREEKAEATRQARLQQKVSLQTQALVAALRLAAHQAPGGGGPSKPGALPGRCFKCGQEGHWARQCPCPRPPTKPCPDCKRLGHWRDECPSGTVGSPPTPLCGGQAGLQEALELLGLLDD